MTIESTIEGEARVVRLFGRMTEETALQFEQTSQDSLDAGLKRLVVDIGELQYVNSLGLRSFVRVAKAVHAADGVAALCGMKGMVKEIFEMAHMGALFRTFDSVESALASLG